MKKYFFITGLLTLFCSLSIFRATAQNVDFNEDFSKYEIGATPRSIKTNGAATISRPAGQQGKWLSIQDNTTYKLNRPVSLPKSFTFEFDILALAEQIKDMSPISFGFVKDNTAREYISNGGAFVQLHYYDGDAVNIGNYDLSKEASTKFDLSATANRAVHVKLVVRGNQMAVYLDNTKLADTTPGSQVFLHQRTQ